MLSKREQYPAWVERIYGWLWRRFGIKWDGRFAFGATMVQIILMWKTGLNNCRIKEKLLQSNGVLSTPLAPWMYGLSERLVRVSKEVLNQCALKCPFCLHYNNDFVWLKPLQSNVQWDRLKPCYIPKWSKLSFLFYIITLLRHYIPILE